MIIVNAVLLETPNKQLILQQRDNIPNIIDPGKISTFGGHCLKNEPPDISALRELKEETTLKLSLSDLTHLATFKLHSLNKEAYVYYAKNINLSLIDVKEGLGYVLISKTDNLEQLNLAPFARYIIDIYWRNK